MTLNCLFDPSEGIYSPDKDTKGNIEKARGGPPLSACAERGNARAETLTLIITPPVCRRRTNADSSSRPWGAS